ncbi:MAG: glucosamine-1-phosphate N-acetyltransferase, partial [Sulfolobales archaeon]
GTILANLRVDEKTVKVRVKGVLEDSGRKKLGAFIGGYVRTGVNVSVFPGVKIGAYSWIYPGVVVTDDVPPKSILKHNGVLVSME